MMQAVVSSTTLKQDRNSNPSHFTSFGEIFLPKFYFSLDCYFLSLLHYMLLFERFMIENKLYLILKQ